METEFRLPTDADKALALEWIAAHGEVAPHPSWLPSVGGVAVVDGEPQAIVFAYTDQSTGVCHLDWLCTRPGLSPVEASRWIALALDGVEHVASRLFPGDFVMVGCVRSDAMAKLAERQGFTPLGKSNLIAKQGKTQP